VSFVLDFWNGLVSQPWLIRAAIGAVFGAVLFVVVPPLVGKKETSVARGGDGGIAEVGGDGRAVGGSGGRVIGKDGGQGGAGGAAKVRGSGTAIGGSGGHVTDR
jgi:hypothetical protein